MSDDNPAKYHRRSMRLPAYDYTSFGAYYVTVCTRERVPYFSDPICKNMVEEAWKGLPKHFSTIRLDAFAILPDHVHALLWLIPTEKSRPALGTIVCTFRADVARDWSRHVQANGGVKPASIWQSGYYDRVIRNEHELQQKRLYILNNPVKHAMRRNGYEG
ncbi:MAG TPA: transposase [Ktedonobacteraceae bacterium]|nr:transposase [Ktedonobacteraceae bacterium]